MYVLFFHVDWAGKGRLFTEQNKLGVCVLFHQFPCFICLSVKNSQHLRLCNSVGCVLSMYLFSTSFC